MNNNKYNDSDYYGYTYLTYDTLKNKVYVGQKKSPVYCKYYFGSGLIISRIIKKRKNTLRNYVIEWCETKNALDESEIRWIAYFRREFGEENCYNIQNGGHSGDIFTNNPNKEEIRKKYSENAQRNKKHLSIINSGENNPTYGWKWLNNGEEEIKLPPEEFDSYLDKGYTFGRSNKVMRKVAEKHIGNKAWNKGLKCPQCCKSKGKICITNGIINKFIYKHELNDYIDKGFWKGMYKNEIKKSKS